jgi:hypothetical protein
VQNGEPGTLTFLNPQFAILHFAFFTLHFSFCAYLFWYGRPEKNFRQPATAFWLDVGAVGFVDNLADSGALHEPQRMGPPQTNPFTRTRGSTTNQSRRKRAVKS